MSNYPRIPGMYHKKKLKYKSNNILFFLNYTSYKVQGFYGEYYNSFNLCVQI
jgi:hypothetical protein